MPTVARELMPDLDVRRLARSVHEAAARLRDDCEEIEPFDRFLLERQVWWGRLFLDPDSQYEIVALTRKQHRTALAIRNSLSASCFPRLRQREVPLDPDAAIIAEALATGYDLLTTANMRSIDHWEVNEWVRRQAKMYPRPLDGDQGDCDISVSESRDVRVTHVGGVEAISGLDKFYK